MSDFQLGINPRDFNVNLFRHADFNQTIRTKADAPPFPAAPEIRFSSDTVWAAELLEDDSVAVWEIDKADVDDVIEEIGSSKLVRLFCGDAGWAEGRVVVHG